MFVLRMGAARRTYLLITALFIVATIFASWFYLKQEYEALLREKEVALLSVASEVERSLDNDLFAIEVGKINTMPISQDEKALLMNKLMQPILSQVSANHPNIGMGIYSKEIERVVAIAPIFDTKMLVQVTRPEYTKIYETSTPMFSRVNNSVGFYGKPILNVTYPILYKGQIIGHTWASAKTEDTDLAMVTALSKIVLGSILLIGLLLLVIRTVFTHFNNGLLRLSNQISGHKHSLASLADFPELIPVLETVNKLEDDLKKRTEALEQSETRLRLILDQCPVGIVVVDKQGTVEVMNSSLVSASPRNSWKDSVGQSYFDLVSSTGVSKEDSPIYWALQGTSIRDARLMREQRHWNVNAIPLTQNEQIIGAIGIYQDITATAQKEQEKLIALERFRRVFSNSLAVMAILRASDMTYIDVNDAWERTWGFTREEAIGRTPKDLGFFDCQAEGEQVASFLTVSKTRPVEYVGHTKSGEKKTVLSQVTVIQDEPERQILYVLLDITQNKQYEEEMAHLDRLNIVGEMAAGIGHEVRNPMTTVRGYLQLLQQKEKFRDYQEQFQTMLEELDRVNAIITEFLSLAKDKTIEMKSGNLNQVISSLEPLLQADAFRRGIDLSMELGVIPLFEFDESEIRQLVLNLVRNGFEAMEGGELVIRTYTNKSSIILEVQDTGPGIPYEVMKKLGTPFVTTKECGTGLGLPVCYRIANRHGANIVVKTGSQGTTFIVTFHA